MKIKEIEKLKKYLLAPHSEKVVFNSDGTWHPLKQGTSPIEGFTIGTRSNRTMPEIEEIIPLIEKDIQMYVSNIRHAGHHTQYLI